MLTTPKYLLVLHIDGKSFQGYFCYHVPKDWSKAVCPVVPQIPQILLLEGSSYIYFFFFLVLRNIPGLPFKDNFWLCQQKLTTFEYSLRPKFMYIPIPYWVFLWPTISFCSVEIQFSKKYVSAQQPFQLSLSGKIFSRKYFSGIYTGDALLQLPPPIFTLCPVLLFCLYITNTARK